MNVLDLFSGIGGFSLGLRRAGMRTVAFCEIDPYCQAVLRKHWPDVPIYDDVRSLKLSDGFADVICGGFPCQDVSIAGRRAGLDADRSGLWWEYARIIGEVRPRYVIVENTPGLLSLGMGEVVGALASLGYDSEWDCVPAGHIGAPHERDRVWIIAYPHGEGPQERIMLTGISRQAGRDGDRQNASLGDWWSIEPDVVRVVHGLPGRVDRIRALGNAIVPQIAEIIGRAIMKL